LDRFADPFDPAGCITLSKIPIVERTLSGFGGEKESRYDQQECKNQKDQQGLVHFV
jgi:hypothetical protein